MLCVSHAQRQSMLWAEPHLSYQLVLAVFRQADLRQPHRRHATHRPPPMNATALPAMGKPAAAACRMPCTSHEAMLAEEMMASSPSAGWHGGALLTPTGKRGEGGKPAVGAAPPSASYRGGACPHQHTPRSWLSALGSAFSGQWMSARKSDATVTPNGHASDAEDVECGSTGCPPSDPEGRIAVSESGAGTPTMFESADGADNTGVGAGAEAALARCVVAQVASLCLDLNPTLDLIPTDTNGPGRARRSHLLGAWS